MPFMRERLKQRRVDMGLTLQEVADTIGVEKPTVQRYESGKISKVDTLTVEKLANAVRCNPSYLMGWADSPNMQEGPSWLTTDEAELLRDYRSLSIQGKEYLRQTMLMSLNTYKKDNLSSGVETSARIG